MQGRHALFCLADPVFYDAPASRRDAAAAFAATGREAPWGWRREERDVWVVLHPVGVALPAQGWKVHVSTTLERAEAVLEAVWAHCVEQRLAFKFLRDRDMLRFHNAKYVARGSSGKFAAIYPRGEEELERTLEVLGARLAGEPGPYILSDLRYGSGPLYVRYGGFAERYCLDETGQRVLAVEAPDGTLVPDVRKPTFDPPPWVRLPGFLAPHLQARSGRLDDFGYRIERALHFSNGGGVYVAERKADGQRVVLKEARPHAALDLAGVDAVGRLERERWALQRLQGIAGIPRLHEAFTFWEHHFLAVEHVDGDPASAWLGARHPLVQPDPDEAALDAFRREALRLVGRVTDLLAAVHARGVVMCDLHPGNLLVAEDGTPTLIDFEGASAAAEDQPPALGALGFTPFTPKRGVDIDRHALAALRLWVFLPLTNVIGLDPSKVEAFVDLVRRRFDLPRAYCDGILAELAPDAGAADAPVLHASAGTPLELDLDRDEPDWPAMRDSMAAAIAASATPDRGDRLFPGDIMQFTHDGVGFAYGAAGVLWALSVTGADHAARAAGGDTTAWQHWLIDRARAGAAARPGFYTGIHGIAYTLDHLGHPDIAAELLASPAARTDQLHDPTLFSGLAGTGLTALHLASRLDDDHLHHHARTAGARLTAMLDAPRDPTRTGRPDTGPGSATAGLLHGWSGPALLLTRLHQATGDTHWADAARRAIHRDLDATTTTDTGTLSVEETDSRLLSYLDTGSAGIGLAAAELLPHHHDPRLHHAIHGVIRATSIEFVLEPQLLNGRAGLLATLTHLAPHATDQAAVTRTIHRHIRRLAWHALSYRGHLAFPGDQGLRLSMDLATGTAGVLLATATACHPHHPTLPFLTPPTHTQPDTNDTRKEVLSG